VLIYSFLYLGSLYFKKYGWQEWQSYIWNYYKITHPLFTYKTYYKLSEAIFYNKISGPYLVVKHNVSIIIEQLHRTLNLYTISNKSIEKKSHLSLEISETNNGWDTFSKSRMINLWPTMLIVYECLQKIWMQRNLVFNSKINRLSNCNMRLLNKILVGNISLKFRALTSASWTCSSWINNITTYLLTTMPEYARKKSKQ
jgi:hypothetical protein